MQGQSLTLSQGVIQMEVLPGQVGTLFTRFTLGGWSKSSLRLLASKRLMSDGQQQAAAAAEIRNEKDTNLLREKAGRIETGG